MINNVNLGNSKTPNSFSVNKTENNLSCKNSPTFGYQENHRQTPVKDLFLSLTSTLMGTVGFNAVLWGLQDLVNGKVLIGKINKHFTKNINDKNQLAQLAFEMRDKNGLKDKVNIFQTLQKGQAYYTNKTNSVVVGKDQFSALFHELGHATVENNTKILKFLQNFRGKYTFLSLALYTIINQRRKTNTEDNQSLISKIANSDAVVPLIAFSPELITEAKATSYGLKFLKEKLKSGAIDKNLFKNIKRSYLTCFSTYLFIPLSIMLMEAIQNSVDKKIDERRRISYYGY